MSKKQVDVLRFFRLVKQANVAFNPFDNRIAGFKMMYRTLQGHRIRKHNPKFECKADIFFSKQDPKFSITYVNGLTENVPVLGRSQADMLDDLEYRVHRLRRKGVRNPDIEDSDADD